MFSAVLRWLAALACALIIAQSVMLCGATGWRAFTRYPDPELDQDTSGFDDLLGGTGLGDAAGELPRLENRFTFGWLPSPTIGPEGISVLTTAGPAALAMIVLVAVPRAKNRTSAGSPGTT